MTTQANRAEPGAGTRYLVTREGAKWLVWSARADRFPRIVSRHITEAAAHKAVARLSSSGSSGEAR